MSYLINARQKAEQALRQAKNGGGGVRENELIPARIIAANGSGWDVATVDAAGNIGRVYERIFAHPVTAAFTAGDDCWLWIPADGESPVIMATGSGGGGCATLPSEIGVYFD